MMYVVYFSGSYVAKNKLERDQIELLESLDRTFLKNSADLDRFKDNVITDLKRLNSKHPKCRPFNPSFMRLGRDEMDWYLSGIRVVNFYVYAVDKVFGRTHGDVRANSDSPILKGEKQQKAKQGAGV